jgi:TRAP-type transport system periplasmic protein
MKHNARYFIASVMTATILGGFGTAAAATELKFSLLLPEHHILVQKVFKPFEEEVEAKSNGELQITLYPSAVLGSGKEQLRLTETGVADIALVVPTYTRGRFPLMESGLLPFAFDSAAHGTKVMDALRDEYIEPEFDSVKLLYPAMTSPTALLTVSKPLALLSDIKGVSLRGTGGEQNTILEGLGANLVTVPASDLYVAMERGTIEGTILSLASAPGYKLEEIVKYVNQVNFSSTPITVVMNKATWEGLSPEQQAVIEEAAHNAAIATGEAYDAADIEGLEKLKAQGAQVVNFSPEDVAELKKVTAPSWDNWQAKLTADGKNGKAFMDAFRSAIESEK